MHYEGFLLQATPLSITLGASHPCANHYLHNLGTGVVCLLFWVLTKQGLFISLSWSVQSKLYVEQKGLWGNDPPWEVDHPQLAHTSGTLPFGFFALLPFFPFGFLPFWLFALLPFCHFAFFPFAFSTCLLFFTIASAFPLTTLRDSLWTKLHDYQFKFKFVLMLTTARNFVDRFLMYTQHQVPFETPWDTIKILIGLIEKYHF